MDRNDALGLLVAPHMFLRFIGLSFLVQGVDSPSLPADFAVPAGYDDLVAAILAIALVWTFNLWGAGDLLYAIYQGNIHAKIDPGNFGAAFYSPTFVVPSL